MRYVGRKVFGQEDNGDMWWKNEEVKKAISRRMHTGRCIGIYKVEYEQI